MQNKPTLLITSCVNPSENVPFTSLRDSNLRVNLTIQKLSLWIKNQDLNYVICDGSGFDFVPLTSELFPTSEIECLNFKNNETKVSELGKGYGEGEIIKYALNNSIYLNNVEFFIKCTAKFYVPNFKDCFKFWNGKFLSRGDISFGLYSGLTTLSMIDTRFYIVNKKLYISDFMDSYMKVDDRRGYYLEHVFRDVVLEKKMSNFLFPIVPHIQGISGSNATDSELTHPQSWHDLEFKKIIKAKLSSNFIA